MTSDTEQEIWFMLLGAALASKDARERIFKSLEPHDAPSPPMQNVFACLQHDDHDKIHECFLDLGFRTSPRGSILGQLVDRLRDHIFQSSVKKKMFLLSHSTGIDKRHMKETLKKILDDLEDSEDDDAEGN